jgi:hypothetical protein
MVARQDSPMGSGPSGTGSLDPGRGGRPATRRHERGRAARFLAFRHPRWTALLGWFSRRSARSTPSIRRPRRFSGRDLPSHDRPRLPVGGEEPRLARSTGRLARLRSRPWSTLTTHLINLTPAPLLHLRTRVHVTFMTLGSWSTAPARRTWNGGLRTALDKGSLHVREVRIPDLRRCRGQHVVPNFREAAC